MKRKALAVFFFLPIAVGIALLVAGIVVGNNVLLTTGIGVIFGGGFVSAVVALVFKCLRVRERRKNPPASEDEYVPEDERMMEATAKVWSLSSGGDKIKGILFAGGFIACCVLFVVFASMGKITWALIAWGCGMGMILLAFLVVKIKEHFSTDKRVERFTEGEGIVTACELAHQDDEKGRTMYKATVDYEGRQVECFCFRSYEAGQRVQLLHDHQNDYTMINE